MPQRLPWCMLPLEDSYNGEQHMSRATETIILIALFVLRLGVPAAITIAVGFLLHRLDRKWEKEAQQKAANPQVSSRSAATTAPAWRPCWLIKGCSSERMQNCPAHANQSLPCWLARLRVEGRLPSGCAGCEVFRSSQRGLAGHA
jgi:hypothetical protein